MFKKPEPAIDEQVKVMNEKEPHQPHILGAPSSQETPLKGIQPSYIPCPVCGRAFKTKSEMERHLDTMHHETKGHE
jgi:predicted transcriptional regulator